MKKIWTEIREHSVFMFFIVWCVIVIISLYIDNKNIRRTPVEEITQIDSLTKVSDSIEIEIIKVNNDRYEELKKIDALDNDSAVKLFKKLLSEYDSSFYGRARLYYYFDE